jgi:hypothetical protein
VKCLFLPFKFLKKGIFRIQKVHLSLEFPGQKRISRFGVMSKIRFVLGISVPKEFSIVKMRWVCMERKRYKGQIHRIVPDAVSASVRKFADVCQELCALRSPGFSHYRALIPLFSACDKGIRAHYIGIFMLLRARRSV